MKTKDLQEFIAAIEAARTADDFEYLGLRTIDAGHDPLENSHIWIDNERTTEALDGVCATNVNGREAFKQHKLEDGYCTVGYYCGDRTYLMASFYSEYGQDDDELVMLDPIVIAVLER
ncbi:MAG: hypothetical protein KDK11_05795 [Maritimibacter sp.]|nr:hypothetical protein [Maritimibacter sp.]